MSTFDQIIKALFDAQMQKWISDSSLYTFFKHKSFCRFYIDKDSKVVILVSQWLYNATSSIVKRLSNSHYGTQSCMMGFNVV